MENTMDELNKFRKILEDVTKGIPSRHPQRINCLLKDYSHSIKVQGNPNVMDTTTDCFMYVFKDNLPDRLRKTIDKVSENSQDNTINIFQELLDNDFIELHDTQRIEDAVIVYFDNGIAKHFGRIVNGEIISKWGKGLIWKHPVFEVPISYGNIVKYSNGKINMVVLEGILKKGTGGTGDSHPGVDR